MQFIRVTLVISALMLSACVKEKIIERQAPADIRESFNAEKLCEKTNCLKMKKTSLGKVFMFIASGRTTGSTPQWIDLKPQLVSFERSGDQVALLEENYHSVYEEITGRDLIQTFEILAEDEESVTFNWGAGPKTLVFESPYDVSGPDRDPADESSDLATANRQYYPVVDAFTQNARVVDGKLQIDQIVKIRYNDDKKGNIDESLNMNFQLIPYNPSPNFKKVAADPNRFVGFFVTKVSKKGYSKTQDDLINHWDLEKPITVAVSSSVPDQYVQAIREGALYWNKVYGKDVVQVVTGFNPSSAPQERTIIIRWVPWLDSGAAYAISQADPLTGEILRGQVFLPTIFTRIGSANLVAANGGAPTLMSKVAVACDLTAKLNKVNILAKEADDSKRLQLAQDSVRATVAHELGHAMGLRHNFAGSFSSKYSAARIYDSISDYFKNPNHQGLETSTSIMDYVSGIDDILMSVRLKHAPLSYDKMAMDYVYNGRRPSPQVSKFCTDEDISNALSSGKQIYGCARFDAGNNPLYRAFLDAKDEKENLVNVLFTSILGRHMPGDQPGTEVNLTAIIEATKVWSQANLEAMKLTREALFNVNQQGAKKSNFVSLQKHLMNPTGQYKDESDDALTAQLMSNLVEAGGLAGMLEALTMNKSGQQDVTWFNDQVAALEKAGFYRQGKALNGRDYVLTDAKIDEIRRYFAEAAEINTIVVQEYAASFLFPTKDAKDTKGRTIALSPNAATLASFGNLDPFLKSWFALDPELIQVDLDGKSIDLPTPLLPWDLQRQALSFADSTLVDTVTANKTKGLILNAVESNIKAVFAALGIPVTATDSGTLELLFADFKSKHQLQPEAVAFVDELLKLYKEVEKIK